MIASIHQPMYLPWPPYFSKIAQSDVFVFFDDVQYPRSKGFFNRNSIKGAQGPIELTVPIKSKGDLLTIKEVSVDNSQPWRKKHWKAITVNYAKAPYFGRFRARFEAIYQDDSLEKFGDLTMSLIAAVCECAGIGTKLVRSSEICPSNNIGADHILDIVKALGADQYLTGRGAGSLRYMDEGAYAAQGIKVLWHEPERAEYPQLWGAFAPDLSIVDMLFNLGPDCKSLLLRRPPQ